MTASAATTSLGERVRVEFTYESNGESAHWNVNAGFYVSTNNYISTGDRLVATTVVGLNRANVNTRLDEFRLPSDLLVGQQYYLGVIIDHDDAITEVSESNNAAYHAFTVTCDSVPDVQSRNKAPNTRSLTTSLYAVGNGFALAAQPAMSGHAAGLVFGFDTPYSLQLAGGQWLLCLDLGGSGEIFGFAPQTGGHIPYSGAVPGTSDLCGFTSTAQAIYYGGIVPFALSNAYDITIGGI